MKWEKIANRVWKATGKYGVFFIEQSGKVFWGRYVSKCECTSFKMPPKLKLSEAKKQCEENYYWEADG